MVFYQSNTLYFRLRREIPRRKDEYLYMSGTKRKGGMLEFIMPSEFTPSPYQSEGSTLLLF